MVEKGEKGESSRNTSLDSGLVLSNDVWECDDINQAQEIEKLDKQLLLAAKHQKAFNEAIHRKKVSLLMRNKVNEYLKTGAEDFGTIKYGEMLVKEEERIEVRLVTLSLPPIELKDLKDRVVFYNKLIKTRAYFPWKTKWVYEQRGESNETLGTGLHIHLICPITKKKKSELIRDISNQFKIEKNFIDVQIRPLSHCEEYTLGVKEEHKRLKQDFDKIMRSRYDISPYYEK